MRRRRKAHYQWIRGEQSDTNVASLNFDLLSDYRTVAGINVNIPEFTIWRVRIKISITLTLSPNAYLPSNGIFIGVWVDNFDLTKITAALSQKYEQKYMLWDKMFQAEQEVQGGSLLANQIPSLYKEYDIKTRRVCPNILETLLLQLTPGGNVSTFSYDMWYLVLLRLRA